MSPPHCCCVEQSSGQICDHLSVPWSQSASQTSPSFLLVTWRGTYGQGVSHKHLSPLPAGSYSPTHHTASRYWRVPQPGHARMRWRQDRKPGQKARRHWEGRELSLWSLQSPVQNFCSINNIAMTGLAGRPHSFYREIFPCKNVKIAMRHASGLSRRPLSMARPCSQK